MDQADQAKVTCGERRIFLRNRANPVAIQNAKIGSSVVKTIKKLHNVRFQNIPESLVENHREAIRSKSFFRCTGEDRQLNFVNSEGGRKARKISIVSTIKGG